MKKNSPIPSANTGFADPQAASYASITEALAAGNVFADQCPSRLILNHITSRWAIYINKVDNAVWQTCFQENAHKHLGRINLCIGRFPNNCITAHSCGGRQVASNSCEIERGNSKYESFQWSPFHTVMHTCSANRLLLINFT